MVLGRFLALQPAPVVGIFSAADYDLYGGGTASLNIYC